MLLLIVSFLCSFSCRRTMRRCCRDHLAENSSMTTPSNWWGATRTWRKRSLWDCSTSTTSGKPWSRPSPRAQATRTTAPCSKVSEKWLLTPAGPPPGGDLHNLLWPLDVLYKFQNWLSILLGQGLCQYQAQKWQQTCFRLENKWPNKVKLEVFDLWFRGQISDSKAVYHRANECAWAEQHDLDTDEGVCCRKREAQKTLGEISVRAKDKVDHFSWCVGDTFISEPSYEGLHFIHLLSFPSLRSDGLNLVSGLDLQCAISVSVCDLLLFVQQKFLSSFFSLSKKRSVNSNLKNITTFLLNDNALSFETSGFMEPVSFWKNWRRNWSIFFSLIFPKFHNFLTKFCLWIKKKKRNCPDFPNEELCLGSNILDKSISTTIDFDFTHNENDFTQFPWSKKVSDCKVEKELMQKQIYVRSCVQCSVTYLRSGVWARIQSSLHGGESPTVSQRLQALIKRADQLHN